MQKKLAIVLINWNGYQDTIECLDSIRGSSFKGSSVFVIDNGSSDDSVSKLKNWAEEKGTALSWSFSKLANFQRKSSFSSNHVYIIQSLDNLGFARGNNVIWEQVRNEFEYTLILNNDTIVDINALSTMVESMDSDESIAALSCDIRYYDNRKRLWRAGGKFAWYGDRKYYTQKKIDGWKRAGRDLIKTEFITGCAMMVRKSASGQVGIFTENFFFGEEDFNYCQRLKLAGLKVSTVLTATIYHKVSGSIKKQQAPYNKFILHYTNRIINQKYFMSFPIWQLWRLMYLAGIYVRALKVFRTIKRVSKVMHRIESYTAKLDKVSYKTFMEISKLSEDTV